MEKRSIVVAKSLIAIGVVTSSLLLNACNSSESVSPVQVSCPSDSKGWEQWRDQSIDSLFSNYSEDEAHTDRRYLDIEAMTKLAHDDLHTLDSCGLTKESIPGELENYFRFISNVGGVRKPTHKFGFSISDREYVDVAEPYIKIPELLQSQDFLQAVSRPDSYETAFKLIQEHNRTLPPGKHWQPLIYDSQYLTSPDNTTYGRFFIHVPDEVDGEAVDKWIQFAIATPETDQTVFCPEGNAPEGVTTCSLSIVSVRQLSDSDKTQVYLMDFRRQYHEDGSIGIKNNIEANGLTVSCAYCHKSPVLPIHPAREYVFKDKQLVENVDKSTVGQVAARLNQRIANYGPPNFGDFFTPANYGPPIGPDIKRSKEFLSSCRGSVNFEEGQLDELMSCARCHNGSLIGEINFPQAAYTSNDLEFLQLPDGSVHALVERYITTAQMPLPPPPTALTTEQTKALTHCLMTEYFNPENKSGLLTNWLRQ